MTRFHQQCLNREPDSAGDTAWLGKLAAGTTREEAADGVTHSAEFTNLQAEYEITPY